MVDLENSYLNKSLASGRNIRVAVLAHNSYLDCLCLLKQSYNNFQVDDRFGHSIDVIKDLELRNLIVVDYDLIVLYGSSFYEEFVLEELKQIALQISQTKGKRVTIGYSYNTKLDSKPLRQIKLCSINGCDEYNEVVKISSPDIFDLLDITMTRHDELNNQKIKLK